MRGERKLTTIREIFAGAGLTPTARVRWGAPVTTGLPGVYAVATTDDVDAGMGLADCPLDPAAVRRLLQVRAEACVDGVPATEASLAARLRSMWVAGEPVVYVGLAGLSLSYRVGQFYATALGARAPHAGGWPVKMLTLERVWVHYAPCSDPDAAERQMASAFAAGLSTACLTALVDPDVPVPYANLMIPGGRRKRHGLTGVKEARRASGQVAPRPPVRPLTPTPPSVPARLGSRPITPGSGLRTQNITPADIGAGRIRVPSATKRALPHDRAQIDVTLLGESLCGCRWDPRYVPDKERSGTISIPRGVLQRLVRPGTQLTVTAVDGGVRLS